MKNSIFLKVLGFSIVAILVGMFLTSQMGERKNLGFPWQIDVMPDGATRIFQIHLGSTSLGEAEILFQEPAELTLFVPQDEKPVVEAYFDSVMTGGLKAKIIVSFDYSETEIDAMYKRGVRISTLGSGTRKVTLHEDDLQQIRQKAIIALTYLPSINLDEQLIEKRFGQPSEKVTDSISGAVHWLYPNKGVDVTLSTEAKEVLQYVIPANFSKLVTPLKLKPETESQGE